MFGDDDAKERDTKRWRGLRVKKHTRVEDYPLLAELSSEEEVALSKAAANARAGEKAILKAARDRGIQVEERLCEKFRRVLHCVLVRFAFKLG